ncbi:hypothetical protein BCR33DRAFT_851406 [Rhizoclosmatium globosum]|uniref:Uncharacterized protein n=1 Tax=Rhizoclosmatium globosum TaxID=329046 RepID=A0A1Y2C783_9FUNG|nr:hypothetical protein BCR33DRAFT_851406 [Rhizoclosmatium globosum]|eukprot:ORY42754.1 hypothetical protein BCR33DRAFT_851406 [Rhizoclosmatium globosum]
MNPLAPPNILAEEQQLQHALHTTSTATATATATEVGAPANAASIESVAADIALNWVVLPFANGFFFRFFNLFFKARSAAKQQAKLRK